MSASAGARAAVPGATIVYTDGACIGNPGPGGWAWAEEGEGGREESGGEARTTNQRMELTAVLRAVEAHGARLVVVSDSAYVVRCFHDGWWRDWEARRWRNSGGKPVANQDLWRPLIAKVHALGDTIEWRWVKGHAGHAMNERVDELANAAARRAAEGRGG